MPRPTMLVVAAGLSIAGAALGVGVGRSTLNAIDPANFKDPDPPFYSDMAPSRPRADWARVQAQDYQAASQAIPAEGCAGCPWPAAPASRPDRAATRDDQPRTAVAPPERAEAPVRIVVVDAPPEPDWNGVERYARYPVERYGDSAVEEDDGGEGDAGTQ